MPDFLNRLAARALGVAPVAQPIVPAMFSPASVEVREPASHSFVEMSESPAALPLSDAMAPAEARLDLDRQRGADAPLVPPDSSAVSLRDSGMSATSAQPRLHRPPLSTVPSLAAPSRRESQSEREVEAEITPRFHIPPAQPDTTGIAERQVIVAKPMGNEATVQLAPLFSAVASAHEGRVQPSRRSDFVAPAPEAPVIRVTIGRVDVRAEFPVAPWRPAPRRAQAAALSLEEYAKQRREGQR